MKKVFVAVSLFLFSFMLYSQDITNSETSQNNILTNSNNEFFDYIEKGDINKIRELLKQGTDVNGTNSEGWSALHVAVKANNTAVLKELLSQKWIDMNPVLPVDTILMDGDNKWYADGQTPLLLASYYGYADIVNMLLSYGADVLAKDSVDDAMAVHIASARGNANVVSVILDSSAARSAGIDIVNVGDNTGTTPLMWASMNNQVTVISALIKFKADVNFQDDDGWTALHFAAASDSYRAVEILLKNKADANIADIEGKKPVDITTDTDIKELLNKYTSAETENNNTAEK
ncbi:ankyrin repeat domain-containing protein [Brachyspira hyodysenteriae]|uniref:ankyrin repeat domain-containing protein n=1 Tax=Brachyspira hyodysenteriae TaxID=159 RepID=UPI0022CD29D6|nr:ankyrin repeat domain-containing protein [Brachyspira hyodysenteriae]MCZ9955246.1 ankyrin repeat domain-containing protein [Brachyspira hyodysenteriae]MCZ9980381.1 ankyrin repeat domain-containing protein [Brachyspira hyodysenteriae]